MVALTIGMPSYNDFDGVYVTLQGLRLYHDLADVELLAADNFGCEHTKQFVEEWAKGRYVLAAGAVTALAAVHFRVDDVSADDNKTRKRQVCWASLKTMRDGIADVLFGGEDRSIPRALRERPLGMER
jgi:hypothetical protein